MKGARESWSLVDVAAAQQRDELPQDLVNRGHGQLARFTYLSGQTLPARAQISDPGRSLPTQNIP